MGKKMAIATATAKKVAENVELDEASAGMDEAGDKIEKAMKDGNLKDVIKTIKTPHLRGLHTYNMGYSGAHQHEAIPHIKKELNRRGVHKFMEDNKFLNGALRRLEEGRGRPPKEGSAAWHRQQAAKTAGKDGEETKALEVQLRKSVSINAPVKFDDGKSHEIHPNHAQRFSDHMAARRTSQEKAEFQKRASKSHDEFKKAVSEPIPSGNKGTGEIVRYR
jgi:hypothetical protein